MRTEKIRRENISTSFSSSMPKKIWLNVPYVLFYESLSIAQISLYYNFNNFVHLILRSLSRWICWFRNFHHYQIENQFVIVDFIQILYRCRYVRSFLQNYSNQKWNFLVIIYSMFHRKNYLLAIFSVCIFAIVRHSCVR